MKCPFGMGPIFRGELLVLGRVILGCLQFSFVETPESSSLSLWMLKLLMECLQHHEGVFVFLVQTVESSIFIHIPWKMHMLHNATYKIIYIINYIYIYNLSGQVQKTQEKGWLYLYNCNFQILQIFQDICQSIERIEFVPSLFWGATASTLYNNVFFAEHSPPLCLKRSHVLPVRFSSRQKVWGLRSQFCKRAGQVPRGSSHWQAGVQCGRSLVFFNRHP